MTLLTASLIKVADAEAFGSYLDSSKYFGRPGSVVKSDMILNAAQQSGISPRLLAAIIANESAWGTHPAAVKANNFSGSMGKGSQLFQYSSPQEGLNAAAQNLASRYWSKGLRTIPQIGKVYAPTVKATNDPHGINKGWIPTVSAIYNKIPGLTGPTQQPSAPAPPPPVAAAPSPAVKVQGTPPPGYVSGGPPLSHYPSPVLAKGAPPVDATVVP